MFKLKTILTLITLSLTASTLYASDPVPANTNPQTPVLTTQTTNNQQPAMQDKMGNMPEEENAMMMKMMPHCMENMNAMKQNINNLTVEVDTLKKRQNLLEQRLETMQQMISNQQVAKKK